MREVVILLLVVVLAIMVVGAVNQEQRVDLDYVVGTWENVSVLDLSAVAAGVVFVTGLVCAGMVRAGLIGGRRKLERELQETYTRLRAAEAKAPAGPPVSEASPSGTAGGRGEATMTMASAAGPVAAAALSPHEPAAAPPTDVGHAHLVSRQAPEITAHTQFPPDAPDDEGTAADATAAADQTAAPLEPVEGATVVLPPAEEQTLIAELPRDAAGEDAAAEEGDPATGGRSRAEEPPSGSTG